MTSLRQLFRNPQNQVNSGVDVPVTLSPPAANSVAQTGQAGRLELDISPGDPLLAYLQSTSGAIDLSRLSLGSPALEKLRQAGVTLVVPLVSQGELIGMINLGPRLSEQEYSSDDRKLLGDLATQAAPSVRVAQLVSRQRQEARERERIEQELRVARLIQQTLLPRDVPSVAGWRVAAHYQPAREVGGDFYDFMYFDDGRLGIVVGDVTDKGVPAALVMATTRTLLRSAAERLVSPGRVLERVNDLLHEDIPPKMFVTCLYAMLDPQTGTLCYANAGHDLPYVRGAGPVRELRATGMPLGLMPGMTYEEKETTLACGDTVLFYSDGLAEAHDPAGEMFGFPRLQALLGTYDQESDLITYALDALVRFTGPGWEQEDDVTLVTLECISDALRSADGSPNRGTEAPVTSDVAPHFDRAEQHSLENTSEGAVAPGDAWQTLAEFTVASAPGNERIAMERVAATVESLGFPQAKVDRLKTAVAEATMNAMEHGNKYRPDVPVQIRVELLDVESPSAVRIQITDQGGGQFLQEAETPDIEAKLAGLQSPRGWGLFLIQNMVDELKVTSDDLHHTVQLTLNL